MGVGTYVRNLIETQIEALKNVFERFEGSNTSDGQLLKLEEGDTDEARA